MTETFSEYKIEKNKNYEIKYRKPDEMKDSGIEWLGEIPKDWEVTKIKYNTYVKGRIGWQGLKFEEFIEKGPFLVTGTDFENGNILWENCYHVTYKRYKEAPQIHLKNGDLLITKDGSIGKLAIVRNMPEKAILNSGIFVTRCSNNDYFTRHLYYILSSELFNFYIGLKSFGSTIKHLYQETFENFSFPLPSISKQKGIINFLDIKTAEFDNIIQKKEELIKKLEEAKKSLISEVVTGKVKIVGGELILRNPEEMKDSGVEWLGKIPKGWETKKLKYTCILKSGNNITSEYTNKNGKYPVYGGNGLRGYTDKYTNEGSFILIGRQGALCGNINYAKNKFWASEHAVVVYIKSNIDLFFLGETLRIMNLNQYSLSAAQPGLSVDVIKNLLIPYTSFFNQQIISSFLNKKTKEIDCLILKNKTYIEKLKEAKQSLISEAVTGKIDLRDWEIIETGEQI